MKKILFLATCLLASTVSFAMPKLGDKVVYAVILEVNGQKTTGTVEKELASEDKATSLFILRTTENLNGQSNVQEEKVNPQDLPNEETISAMLDQCADMGGLVEAVTVPAGTFEKTCLLEGSNNEKTERHWFALNVAIFGTVKSEIIEKDIHTTYELQSTNLSK